MKFNKLCKLVLTEKYEGKFIAAAEDAQNKDVDPAIVAWISHKPQVKLPGLDVAFVKRVMVDLKEDLPIKDEITKDNPETQFSNSDVINIIARKVISTFETKESKGTATALLIFRYLVKIGALTVVSWSDISASDVPEDERILKAVGDPESTEWLSGNKEKLGGADVEKITGGYGPEKREYDPDLFG